MAPIDGRGVSSISLPLYHGDAHQCPYLPDRTARNEYAIASRLEPATLQKLMDLGFRRSGYVVYRPVCRDCRECVPIRVPVDRFAPSRSQRRVLRRNVDVRVESQTPVCTDEKWRIYRDYLHYQHDDAMNSDREALEEFLYGSPADTIEMVYRIGRRVVGVGIVDVASGSLSSIYYYFDPAHARRSLGVFGALCEIAECRRRGLRYWYAGYYVRECRRMSYKASYRPYELLQPDGTWRSP